MWYQTITTNTQRKLPLFIYSDYAPRSLHYDSKYANTNHGPPCPNFPDNELFSEAFFASYFEVANGKTCNNNNNSNNAFTIGLPMLWFNEEEIKRHSFNDCIKQSIKKKNGLYFASVTKRKRYYLASTH